MFAFAHRVRAKHLLGGLSALQFTRAQMDGLGIGHGVLIVSWDTNRFELPPSSLIQGTRLAACKTACRWNYSATQRDILSSI